MAVDSTLFVADLPAGTYAAGDMVKLNCHSGPANVRSGRGAAILKRMVGGMINYASGAGTTWRIHIKNSDWVDDAIVLSSYLNDPTSLDQHSGSVRLGNNDSLTPNSAWDVYAECIGGATTTVANSVFALIDIDYPSVSSVTDPDALIGVPASITFDMTGATVNAMGAMGGATWQVQNVDYLKAGYEYALQEISVCSSKSITGFIALSNAAGMGGLTRIVPVFSNPSCIRQTIEYATKLVKGPMDVKTMFFNDAASATTDNVYMIHDFVKRKVA